MTLQQFNALPHEQQCTRLFQDGTYLARRYEGAESVGLYQLPGRFFVEVYYDARAPERMRLRSFTGAVAVEDYVGWTQRPQA